VTLSLSWNAKLFAELSSCCPFVGQCEVALEICILAYSNNIIDSGHHFVSYLHLIVSPRITMDDDDRRAKRSRFDQTEPAEHRRSRFDRRSRSPISRHSNSTRHRSPLSREPRSPNQDHETRTDSPLDPAAAAGMDSTSAQLPKYVQKISYSHCK
jgi:hypothetical protein